VNTKFIIIGLIFLFNPVIQVFDILPDIFGAAFILVGIYRLGRLEENGLAARKSFSWLLYFSIARFITTIIIVYTANLSGAWPILLAALFSYFEAHFTFFGFKHLLRSTELMGLASNNVKVYDNPKIKPFMRLTVIFLALRTVFAIIPEFTALVPPPVPGLGPQRNMALIAISLSIINAMIVLILGIVWLIRGRRLFRSLGNDTKFQSYLNKRYDDEITNMPGASHFHEFKSILLLICAGMVFAIPLVMDGLDVLPTFVSAVFFVWAGVLLRFHYKKPANMMIVSGSVFFVVSLFEWIRRFIFVTNNYNLADPLSFREVIWARVRGDNPVPAIAAEYDFLLGLGIFRMGLYAITMGAAVWGIMKIVRNHTGLNAEVDLDSNRQRGRKVRGKLYSLLMIIMTAFAGSIVISVLTVLLFFHEPAHGLWMLDVLVATTVFFLLRAFAEKTMDRIKGRYHLE